MKKLLSYFFVLIILSIGSCKTTDQDNKSSVASADQETSELQQKLAKEFPKELPPRYKIDGTDKEIENYISKSENQKAIEQSLKSISSQNNGATNNGVGLRNFDNNVESFFCTGVEGSFVGGVGGAICTNRRADYFYVYMGYVGVIAGGSVGGFLLGCSNADASTWQGHYLGLKGEISVVALPAQASYTYFANLRHNCAIGGFKAGAQIGVAVTWIRISQLRNFNSPINSFENQKFGSAKEKGIAVANKEKCNVTAVFNSLTYESKKFFCNATTNATGFGQRALDHCMESCNSTEVEKPNECDQACRDTFHSFCVNGKCD